MAMKKLIRTVTKYKKEIVKGGIYFVLLVVFIQFYLVEAFKNYLKGGTTFRSLTENAEFLPAPYITLCFNPHFKPSILEKYGLTWPFSFEDITNMESNMSSKWKLYQSLSFEYRKDFNIGLYHGFRGGDASDPKPKFETKYVSTYRHGMCYTISHNISLSTEYGYLTLFFNFSSHLSIEDVPQNLQLWLTNPTGWYGLVFDDWPQIKPPVFKIPINAINTNYLLLKMSQTDYHYMQGTEDFEQCLLRKIIMTGSNCEAKCFPIIYNFLPNLPPCNKTVEMKCIFDLIVTYRKERYTCLNLQKNVQYHGNIFLNYIS